MKMIKILAMALLVCTLQACSKSDATNTNATVIKDCTGVYLRIDNKDYMVCNREKFTNIPEGTTVNAIFTKTDNCNMDWIVCMMLHEYHGVIEVHSVQ